MDSIKEVPDMEKSSRRTSDDTRGSTVITIDGPAGAGKSTVAKELARRLQFAYMDTGAMYRALTLKALREKVNLEDEEQLVHLAAQTTIALKGDASSGLKIFLDNEDVSEEIRSLNVTNNTFYIARAPGVRAILVQWQKEIGGRSHVVIEGRDAGTVIFPEAAYKFYLDADSQERASRRIKELRGKGKDVEEDNIQTELQDRDHKDLTRTVGPLKKADDAVFIDSTHLSIDGVVEKIMGFLEGIKGQRI